MKQTSTQEIYALLDSDDEVPSDYDELPYEPAYKNDDRFSNPLFNLMNIGRKDDNQSVLNKATTQQLKDIESKWLTKGVLSSKDAFCSKCVEMSDDASVLWFVNFLTLKDMQSNYKFLKSCLVPQLKQKNDYPITNNVYYEITELNSRKYKLVTF